MQTTVNGTLDKHIPIRKLGARILVMDQVPGGVHEMDYRPDNGANHNHTNHGHSSTAAFQERFHLMVPFLLLKVVDPLVRAHFGFRQHGHLFHSFSRCQLVQSRLHLLRPFISDGALGYEG